MADSGVKTMGGSGKTADPANRRNQVMVGELPGDFLRAGAPLPQVPENHQVTSILHAQQQAGVNVITASNFLGRLSITVAQANLVKNYGLTKMDPYCRVRVGHTIFETPTAYNGAKAPRWNTTVTAYLPVSVDSLYLEIFDERSLTLDNRVAWTHVKIPESVLKGGTVDEWHRLSGKQGVNQEGSVNLVMSLSPATSMYTYAYTTPIMPAPVMMPAYYPPQVPAMMPIAQPQMPMLPPQPPHQQQQQQPHHGPPYTEEDLKQVKDMFPNMELEVVRSVMDANRGNKDATINSLLTMCAE